MILGDCPANYLYLSVLLAGLICICIFKKEEQSLNPFYCITLKNTQ